MNPMVCGSFTTQLSCGSPCSRRRLSLRSGAATNTYRIVVYWLWTAQRPNSRVKNISVATSGAEPEERGTTTAVAPVQLQVAEPAHRATELARRRSRPSARGTSGAFRPGAPCVRALGMPGLPTRAVSSALPERPNAEGFWEHRDCMRTSAHMSRCEMCPGSLL